MISISLAAWAWFFLIGYLLTMMGLGLWAMKLVKNSDDFATARGAYGPLFLAFALTATTASGATFLGIPGITYKIGFPGLWYAFVYPVGVYLGLMVSIKAVTRIGQKMGNRSIPEYLGDRYQSDGLRIGMALFSLMLLFYLAGQLVAGIVMFDQLLGLSPFWALALTAAVLMVYVTMGGAHADILTDGVQGAFMIVLALLIGGLFITGYGVDGGFPAMIARLNALDPNAVKTLYPGNPLAGTAWGVFTIFFAHIPLGMLPHIGNKVWALKPGESQKALVWISFLFGMILPMIALGGILSRALAGDALLQSGANPNHAIPLLFITLFPKWLAAFLGMGVLCAVMSTADGLVVSSSQIFANDIYRRTLAPKWHRTHSPKEIDDTALRISRWATAGVLAASTALAWFLLDVNIALLVWIGVGGTMAALAGPLFIGVFWRGATRSGAIASFIAGGAAFVFLKAGILGPGWLNEQAANPFACATLGQLVGIAVLFAVSFFTEKLDPKHIQEMFE
jgi:SSS family transporter